MKAKSDSQQARISILLVFLIGIVSTGGARAETFVGTTGAVANNTCGGGATLFSATVTGLGRAFEVRSMTLSTSGSGGFERHYFLEGPNARVLEISTGNGSAFANYNNTVFSDSAAQTIANNLSGEFKPEGRVEQIACSPVGTANTFTFASQFGGIDSDGDWKLHVLDTAAGNSGSVTAWSLTFAASSVPPADVAVVAVNPPAPACFAEAQAVEVEVTNAGLNEIATGTLSLALQGAQNAVAPITNAAPIAPGDNAILTFLGVELSLDCQPYRLVVSAALASDALLENNGGVAFTRNLCGDCPLLVFSPLDSGVGSLRQAILAANALAPPVALSFALPGDAPYRIELLSDLPEITNSLTLDGTTQPGFAAGGSGGARQSAFASPPVIEIAGAGLVLNNAPGSVIRGVALDEGAGNGIDISASDNVVIEGCHIGMDPDGQGGEGFELSGVFIEESAGCEVRDSLISNNTGNGVVIAAESDHAKVQGCVIGLAGDGASPAGNGGSGIVVQNSDDVTLGGELDGERNVISENDDGIHVRDANGLQIVNNFIGRDVSGAGGFALGNFDDGIDAAGITNATIKGNVIGNSTDQGIVLGGASAQVQIEGNLLGWNAGGLVSVGNGGNNLLLSGVAGPVVVGGAAAQQRNLIGAADGNGISALDSNGVEIAGNFIGVDGNGAGVPGAGEDGNAGHGIRLERTTATLRDNVISGNGGDGINLASSTDCIIEGNLIGLTADGATPFGNALSGIESNGGSSGLRIGGTDPGQRNVVSANGNDGIDVNAANGEILNNFIGVDAGGTLDRGNGGDGLEVVGPSLVRHNVISGNSGIGILFTGSDNLIEGNHIGVDVSGMAALGNGSSGIATQTLSGATAGNRIGGVSVEQRNIISANGLHGIESFQSVAVTVLNNFIGVDATGSAPLGNGGSGIALTRGDDWQIGDDAAGNVISANDVHGITISVFTDRVRISANSIFANGALGIDLGGEGVTPNDPGDGDNGPNNLQNFPVLASADAAAGRITGSLHSAADHVYRIELFSNLEADASGHGEGETFLGAIEAITDGSGDAAFSFDSPSTLIAGRFVTATATDAEGNTSELSAAIVIASDATAPATATRTDTPTFTPSATASVTSTASASHTATSTATPSVTPTTTPSATSTASPAPTQTSLAVEVDLGRAVGRAGGRACVPASVVSNGFVVSAAGHAGMVFDAAVLDFVSCAINPAIGPGTAADKQSFCGSASPGAAAAIVDGENEHVIADGLLYTASFGIAAGAAPGCYPINHSPSASAAGGNPLPASGAVGEVCVITCTGDCDGDGEISIAEIQRVVNHFLGQPLCRADTPALSCPVADANLDGEIRLAEIQQTINHFLAGGC